MANRVQRPRSPETTIKSFIECAVKNLRKARPDEKKLTRWDDRIQVSYVDAAHPEKDFDVIVELWPANRFQEVGVAVVYHPELGKWKARMNGLRQWNVGKPACQVSADDIKKAVERGIALPLWPQFGY